MKKLLTFSAALVASTALGDTLLEWNMDSAEAVRGYEIQYWNKDGTNMVAVGATKLSAVLPVNAVGTSFRVRATNEFGVSPWSMTAMVPGVPKVVRITFDIAQ